MAKVLGTDYVPFGGIAYQVGSSTNPYGFTGYDTDGESSTNYAVFRNESPSLGRFMRPDPDEEAMTTRIRRVSIDTVMC